MIFPTLLMPSTEKIVLNGQLQYDSPADFSRGGRRHATIPFYEWCTHLMTSGNGRFCSHPFFKCLLLNIKNREQVVSNTTCAIKQMPHEAVMEKDELKQLFETDISKSDGIARQVSAYTNSIPGSAAYWWEQKNDVTAMVTH